MDPSMFITSFSDRRDSHAPSVTSTMSMGGSFDSSFGSDMSSTFSTPAHDLDNPFEMNDWSSAASYRSITPPEAMYSMSSINAMSAMTEQMMFSTPSKSQLGPSMMNYDMPYVHDIYSPISPQDFLTTPPGLYHDLASSPMGEMYTPSPHNRRQFVVPSQTFLEEFEPSTPTHCSNMSLRHTPSTSFPAGIQYFMSPPVTQKIEHHTPSSFDSARSSLCSTPTRRLPSSMHTMESSAVLHRITNGGKVRKSNKSGLIGFVPEGKYKCTHPGCKSEHAFKRQEHLKRHMKTHLAQKDLQCSYCHKKFQQDRSDNYRSHVRLHSKKDQKGSRTKYFPEAEEEVASWAKDHSRSNSIVKGLQPPALIRSSGSFSESDY